MLLMTKDHFTPHDGLDSTQIKDFQPSGSTTATVQSPLTRLTQFIPSSRQIVQFSEGREPRETDKIVYLDGAFDLFRMSTRVRAADG
jgi:ethanolamine-phosphate cytidylyltransferase